MKIDLTKKEIEFLLLLFGDTAESDLSSSKSASFSIEELSLINKLEKALKYSEALEKIILDTSKSGNIYH